MVFGVMGTIIGVLAIVDPEGTQMSNDADPFGGPPGLAGNLARAAAYLTVAAAGAYLLLRPKKK